MIKYTTQRPAFSMLTAIGVMLIMGLLSSFILSTSANTGEETFAQYHKEQAVLLSEAYTEAAILGILRTDTPTPGIACLRAINADITNLIQGNAEAGTPATGRGYHVDVTISYITNNLTPINLVNCAGGILNTNAAGIAVLNFNNTAVIPGLAMIPTASLTAIIDVYVRYKNLSYPTPATAPWVTYHRRTLQKI